MMFFPNAFIYVSELKVTQNSEGTKIKAFDFENPVETFRADVQPNTLTSAQIELYGINSRTANTKKCFTDLENGNHMVVGNRVKVEYDDGTVEYYNVQPLNSWRYHREFILIPVENEK